MDMLTLLRSNGIEVYQTGDGKRDKHISSDKAWYQMVCPICGTDHLWLGYNAEKDFFHCYNHGHVTKYDLFRVWFHDQNVRELLRDLDPVWHEEGEIQERHGVYLPPEPVLSLKHFKRHQAYVRGRGLDPDKMADLWGWGVIPFDGEPPYQDSIFIPVYNRDGVPVSWQTRTIRAQETVRYRAAPKAREAEPIKTLLYGEHLVDPTRSIIVCEGVFDAVAIGLNAVATFGKSLTVPQKLKIAKYLRRIICFDSEEDTQKQASDLGMYLAKFSSGGITDKVTLDAPDPATASKEEIAELRCYAGLVY